MVRSRLGLKALALCGLVLGLMAFTASAAQAEAGSKWLVLDKSGVRVDEKAGLEFFVDGEIENSDGTLLTKIAGVKVEFLCTAGKISNGKLVPSTGSIEKGAKVKFTGCITKLNGATSGPCKPNNEGKEEGVIATKSGHGLIVLRGGEPVVLVLADEGETLATIEMSKECSIGTKVPVIGVLTLKDCKGSASFSSHLVTHLVEQGAGTELWTISKTAEHVATIDGSANTFLIGTHLGYSFGGDPS